MRPRVRALLQNVSTWTKFTAMAAFVVLGFAIGKGNWSNFHAAHQVMNLPKDLFVHDFFLLGYPDEDPKPRPRKEFDKIVFWEKYR